MTKLAAVLIASLFAFNGCDRWPVIKVVLPNGVTRFRRPIEIKGIIAYHDGGTTAFLIRGSNLASMQYGLTAPSRRGERRSFVGAFSPASSGAIFLPSGGKEEKSILYLLQAWQYTHVSRKEEERLLSNRTGVGLSIDEANELKVLHVMNCLQGRIKP